ncbi:MAG: hypothetical protein IPM18_00750 [Phycisphaerales bacterium]|nr:hypothetical protein [Phycisphaerales bacterium]
MRGQQSFIGIALLLAAAVAAAPAQLVQGVVEGIGFPHATGAVIREGQWLPVRVALQVQGSGVFTGELALEATDLDGDIVSYRQAQVTVAGGEGGPKRFWMYAVVNHAPDLPPHVELLDPSGTVVSRLPMPLQQQAVTALHANDLLVLDISAQRVTRLGLIDPSAIAGFAGEGTRPYYRGVIVASMPASEMPDRWLGLEAVDVIVWDRPSPEALSIAQRDALSAWVRAGGQLIIGIGDRWEALRRSDLADLLPLEGDGPIVQVRRLPVFMNRVLASPAPDAQFPDPIAVTTAQPRRDTTVTLGDAAPGTPALSLISMRYEGSGRVVAVAAGLQDLTSVPGVTPGRVFGLLLELNSYTPKFLEAQSRAAGFGDINQQYAYRPVVLPISFSTATAVRGFLAFIFVAAYILAATLGTWVFLLRRKLTAHCWPAFATVAIVASVLSLASVGALRGLSSGLQTFAVLDVDGETGLARGRVLFGYKSAVRDSVGMQLGGEPSFVRPLAAPPDLSSSYVTPERYVALPSQGRLQGVAMRATLKQFEGFWSGELKGRFLADLTANRRSGRLTPNSWLRNDFDFPIDGGVLLYIDPRLNDGAVGVPWRVAGWTQRYPLTEEVGGKLDLAEWPPAVNILAVPFGRILPGETAQQLGQAWYERVDNLYAGWSRRSNLLRSEMPDLPTLYDQQFGWAGTGLLPGMGGGSTGPRETLLLAATRNYYLHNSGRGQFDTVGRNFNLRGLPNVDISHWLMRGQAVLLCWSEQPAPVEVLRNGQRLRAGGGLAVYRLRVPLRYESSPP